MSRPILLVFLLLVVIITSQFEWKQQLMIETVPSVSEKQLRISKREEAVKEKIILSQERNIQRLNEVVQNLREQLLLCRVNKEMTNDSASPFTENAVKLEQQQTLED